MEIIHREFLETNTNSVHAATIEFWKGHPVFAWFGGSREGAGDVAIYLQNVNGDNKIVTIGEDDPIPRWNPILVNLDTSLILFEKAGLFCDRWQTFIKDLSNLGNNFSCKELSSIVLPAGLNGPVKSRPIFEPKSGFMYCGSSVETIYDWTSYIERYSVKNGQLSFDSRSNPLNIPEKVRYFNEFANRNGVSLGIIQPTLWSETNGDDVTYHAFFRSSKGLGRIYYSEIEDIERNIWSKPQPTNLPNPNSAVDIVNHKGKLYLVWNNSETNRFPLFLSHIKRNGSVFEILDTIIISDILNKENFVEKGCNSPELSYPYMIEHNGKLHIVYTLGRSKIEYCVVDV